MSKKDKIEKSGDKKASETSEKKISLKLNEGKCCRCIYRKVKICGNKKSPNSGKYVARKGGCNCFKYND